MQHNVNRLMARKEAKAKKAKEGRLYKEGAGTYGPSAFLDQVFVTIKPKKMEAAPKPEEKQAAPTQDQITLLIAKNPEMNASTFYNLMKSQGFTIVPPKVEADAASANPQAMRSQENKKYDDCVTKVKKSGSADNAYAVCNKTVGQESNKLGFRTVSFSEAQQPVKDNKAGTTRYKVVLLTEGMGNFGAAAYYSKEALESAIPIFEGKKIYADHPAESEATDRPERSVRDILGHFENIHIQESADGGGQHELAGDVVVMGGPTFQWAREIMEHAVEYAKKFPDKEFVGLSINASGDSEEMDIKEAMKKGIPKGALPKIQEAEKQGISTLTYVSKFTDAVSCDLVTEAGAGGKIKDLIEGAKMGKKVTTTESKESMENKENKDMENKHEADATSGDDQAKKADGDHADAAQDEQLFKQMIQKYMGDKEDPSKEETALVKEANEVQKEMGLKYEEAESKACEYLKASKHMAAKRAEKQEASKDTSGGDAGCADDKKDDKDQSKGDSAKESKEGEKTPAKESAQKSELEKLREENAKLTGKLASFQEGERKTAVKIHIEKICKESKLHQSVTAGFKKLVEAAKSVEEVDKTWSVFQEGYRSKKGSADGGIDLGSMTVEMEKTSFSESAGTGGIDLGACGVED